MSAYLVETSKYGDVFEAIADAFAPEYEVHIVTEVEPDLFYALASTGGKIAAYEFRVETSGGMYVMRSCTINMEDVISTDPTLKAVAENHGVA